MLKEKRREERRKNRQWKKNKKKSPVHTHRRSNGWTYKNRHSFDLYRQLRRGARSHRIHCASTIPDPRCRGSSGDALCEISLVNKPIFSSLDTVKQSLNSESRLSTEWSRYIISGDNAMNSENLKACRWMQLIGGRLCLSFFYVPVNLVYNVREVSHLRRRNRARCRHEWRGSTQCPLFFFFVDYKAPRKTNLELSRSASFFPPTTLDSTPTPKVS